MAVKKKKPVARKGKAKPAPKAKPKAVAKAKVKPSAKPAAKATASVPKIKTSSSDFKNKITPLDDRIVVAPEDAAQTSESGLILSVSGGAKPNRGLVLALGRGRRGKKGQVRPLDVQLGDHVMYAEYAGTTLKIDGVEVLILREEEILGIIDGQ